MSKLHRFICVILIFVSIPLIASCKMFGEDVKPIVKIEQWDKQVLEYDNGGSDYEYYFENVDDLLYAIKHEPNKYNNVKIKVVGTIYKNSEKTILVDYTLTSENVPENVSGNIPSTGKDYTTGEELLQSLELRKKILASDNQIDIVISNSIQYAVAETGDYVKLYGVINITRSHIYIDDCEYVLIASLDERIENIENSN